MAELHNRSHERLTSYWNSLRNGRAFPSESQVDPDAIADIWSSCFLVSIDDVTRRLGYRYSYLGTALIDAYGGNISDPEVAARLLSTANLATAHKFDDVVRQRRPITDESEFINVKNLQVRYRSCLLPLGYNDREVSHILGCMSWRAYYIEPHSCRSAG